VVSRGGYEGERVSGIGQPPVVSLRCEAAQQIPYLHGQLVGPTDDQLLDACIWASGSLCSYSVRRAGFDGSPVCSTIARNQR
jgi:hypothetical protein